MFGFRICAPKQGRSFFEYSKKTACENWHQQFNDTTTNQQAQGSQNKNANSLQKGEDLNSTKCNNNSF
jgi:hypothetical protein